MICPYYSEPSFLIIADGVPDLLYYSHLPAIIISMLVGSFVLYKNPQSIAARSLFAVALSFSLWTFVNLIAWTNNDISTIGFFWTWYGILYSLIYISSLYFTYAHLQGGKIPHFLSPLLFLLFLPVIIFAPTNLYFESLNLSLCGVTDAGLYYNNYVYGLGFLIFIWVMTVVTKQYRAASSAEKKPVLLFGLGIGAFLFSFFLGGYIASVFIENSFVLEFYGIFAMTFFMIILGYLIVKFKTFDVKLIGAQALVVGLVILIGSQFFFIESTINYILAGVTFLLSITGGYYLVKSVKMEIQQREEIQSLAASLALANEKLKELDKLKSEFVSIASHQLRAPLTAIRGYTSMLIDGSYGKVPQQAMEPLERISESAKNMAYSVEDYLNVSRIESGNMKYNNSDFNLRDETEHVCDDLRPQALRKGLTLLFRTDLKSKGIINADIGKAIQIIQNLLNNSIKYTEKGSIRVLVRDDVVRKRIYVDIEDTGIGMDEETKSRLFGKFERAKNANEVNHGGTGLGLYVAYAMAKGMNGNITAHSEGDGKGSRFTIELPLAL